MGLLEDLASTLQTAGVGTLSQDLFLGLLPDAPDRALALYETGGLPPLYVHQSLLPSLIRPGVQVRVRSAAYEDGRAHIQDAYDALCQADYLSIQPVQEP